MCRMSVDDAQRPQWMRNALMRRLAGFAQEKAVRGVAGVFALKASFVLSSFGLLTLAARVLGEADFGTYSILFSAVGLFCTVATFGQQVFVMRAWNEYAKPDDVGLLKGALIFSGIACLAGATAVGAAFAGVLALSFPLQLALAATLYLLLFAASQTSMHLVRAAIGVTPGDGVGNLLVVLPAIVYLAICLATGRPGDVGTILLLFAAGAAMVLAVHTVMIWRKIGQAFPQLGSVGAQYQTASWSTRSFKLWISTALEASNQYVDVLIIGYLMSPSVAGAYFVTTRLANAFATATDAMHMFSTRHIPSMYYRRDFVALDALLDSVARMSLVIIGAGLLVLLGAGYWLLAVFNPAYSAYYPALALLCAGTAAVAATGPCAPILMLTGHEGRYLGVIASSVVLRAVLFFALIPPYGILGAVTATAISFIVMALALRHAAKSLAGIDGSILRLTGAEPQAVLDIRRTQP
jgi:O-antigen/teichoic acid export membrane protein